jgi:hypothetical protein
MPERKNFDGFRRDAVIEVVMDATKVNTPDTRESWVARNCSNTRLVSNERKGPLDLVSDRSGAATRFNSHQSAASSIYAAARRATRIASN